MLRYKLNEIKLVDYQSVCIIDTELDVVVLHFNITDKFSFESALALGSKIVENLNKLTNENITGDNC